MRRGWRDGHQETFDYYVTAAQKPDDEELRLSRKPNSPNIRMPPLVHALDDPHRNTLTLCKEVITSP